MIRIVLVALVALAKCKARDTTWFEGTVPHAVTLVIKPK